MKNILFILDRVAHYHRSLFKALETSLSQSGVEFHLLSGYVEEGRTGRVGLKESVVSNEHKYSFKEYRISTYTFRYASSIFDHIASIKPHIVICAAHVGNATHWYLSAFQTRLGFKLVAWQCGYEYNPSAMKRFLLRQFVPRFNLHLAYHSNARKYALSYGARPDQVTLMHNTINEERIVLLPKS